MPQYEDLTRRAMVAGAHADLLQTESRRIVGLAQVLRDAHAGRVLLLRCAWCDRFRVDEEWLHLEAIGKGQQQITSSLRARATHGICSDCFRREQWAAERGRRS